LHFEGELDLSSFLQTTVTGGIDVTADIVELTEIDGSSPVVTSGVTVFPQRLIPSTNSALHGNSDLVDFVLKHFTDELEVNVYGHSYFESTEDSAMLIIYSRDRYCDIKAGDHTSNHVYYVVDLTKNRFYQKCHDDACRQTKATAQVLFE
jgi:hypothetical protein